VIDVHSSFLSSRLRHIPKNKYGVRPNNALFGKNTDPQDSKEYRPSAIHKIFNTLIGSPQKKAILSLLTGAAGGFALVVPPVGIGLLIFSGALMLWAAHDYFWPQGVNKDGGMDSFIQRAVGKDLHQKLMNMTKVEPVNEQVASFIKSYHSFIQSLPGNNYIFNDLTKNAKSHLISLVDSALSSNEPNIQEVGRKIVTACFKPLDVMASIIRKSELKESLNDNEANGPDAETGKTQGEMRERYRSRQKRFFLRDVLIKTKTGETQQISIYAHPEGKNFKFTLSSQDAPVGTVKIFGSNNDDMSIRCEYKIHQDIYPREALLEYLIRLPLLKNKAEHKTLDLDFITDKKDESFFRSMGFIKTSSDDSFLTPSMYLADAGLFKLISTLELHIQ
jgi:hypothetical protein